MRRNLHRCLLAGLTASGLWACSGEAGFREGHYVLDRAVDGKLPLALEADSACMHTLLDGSIDLRPNSAYSSSFNIRRQCGVRAPTVVHTGVREGRYVVRGDTAVMYNDAGARAGEFYMRGRDTLYGRGEKFTLVYVRK